MWVKLLLMRLILEVYPTQFLKNFVLTQTHCSIGDGQFVILDSVNDL